MTTVPSSMRISEKPVVRLAAGFCLRASASIRPDQLDLPVSVMSIDDGRPLQRDVGDFDASDQQREKPQARGQPFGSERRLVGVAEHDVVEADAAGGKQRDTGVAAQHRLKPGGGADFAQGLLPHRFGRNQVARGRRARPPADAGGEQHKSQAFQARMRQSKGGFRLVQRQARRTIASGPLWPTLAGLCDPFKAMWQGFKLTAGCRAGAAARRRRFRRSSF